MEAGWVTGFGERKVGLGEWEVEPIIHQCDSSKRATYLPRVEGARRVSTAANRVLVIGSGGSVHNLRMLKREGPPDPWALGFEGWLRQTIEGGDFDSLIEPSAHPSEFTRAHPSVEYFAPLVVAWAASGRDQPGRRFATGLMYGNLETSGYAFGDTD